MTLEEKVFKMSFTESDCLTIANFLNNVVKDYREQYNACENAHNKNELYKCLEDARTCRGFFANAINRSYCGDDY